MMSLKMIESLFWLSIFSICFILIGYPLVLSILSIFFKKRHQISDTYLPSVTLLIPAYNEENVIKDKIENTLNLDYPKAKLEVIVLVDESTDKTEEIANGYKKVGVRVWVQRPRKGKTSALNYIIPKIENEIIIFSDANSMYKKNAVRRLVRHFIDNTIGLVCGEIRLVDANSLVGLGENFYWRYEKYLKEKESDLQQLLVVNGSIYAIRRNLFTEIDQASADDFVVPMRVAYSGYGLVYDPSAVNEEKISNTAEDQFQRKVRIITRGLTATFSMLKIIFGTSGFRSFAFLFHKFLRWFLFVFVILIFVLNIFLLKFTLYNATFFIQLLFHLFSFIGYMLQKKKIKIKLFYMPFYFNLVNLASFYGFINFLSGKRKSTWEKAGSTR